jgi:hypothetical protein
MVVKDVDIDSRWEILAKEMYVEHVPLHDNKRVELHILSKRDLLTAKTKVT